MHLPGPWAPPAGLERPSLPAANHFWVKHSSTCSEQITPEVQRLHIRFFQKPAQGFFRNLFTEE